MDQQPLKFIIWDVGHGLCIWIQTPNSHHHWIDCGAHTENNFSPAEHVNKNHGVKAIDYLIISHPDADHLRDLPNLVTKIGKPRTLHRNRSLPPDEKYKSEEHEYQKHYKHLDTTYTADIQEATSPLNPAYNGGVLIKGFSNTFSDAIKGNNTSVVMFYAYGDWLFIFPGDIEDVGWTTMWQTNKASIEPLITKAKYRILVAPHHGRQSGYSQGIMDNLKPHVTIVSDVVGQSPTDQRFRTNPLGLTLTVAPATDAKPVKYLTTKAGGRIQFEISSDNSYKLHQYEYW
jgi:competence protein ComEC